MNQKVANALIGGIVGAIVGAFLYGIISGFFGKTWTVEAGGPAIIIYSPFFVPTIVGIISGLIGKIGPSILASIISGVLYLIVGIAILIIGGIFSAGWGGITAVLILAGLLCGGGTIVVIVIQG